MLLSTCIVVAIEIMLTPPPSLPNATDVDDGDGDDDDDNRRPFPHGREKIGVLQQRLKDFSKRKELWKQLNGYKVQAHIGPRHDTKTRKGKKNLLKKKSAQRCDVLFPNSTSRPSGHAGFVLSLSEAAAANEGNQAQHDAIMDWANYITDRFPYRTKLERQALAETNAPALVTHSEIKNGLETANEALEQLLAVNQNHISPSPSPSPSLPPAFWNVANNDASGAKPTPTSCRRRTSQQISQAFHLRA